MKKGLKRGLIFGVIIFFVALLAFIGFSADATQGLVDFWTGFSVTGFDIKIDGEKHRIAFTKLAEGVESSDRMYIMKKNSAFGIIVEQEKQYDAELKDFNLKLLDAAEDNTLSKDEFEELRNLYVDIVPDRKVRLWMKMLQDYGMSRFKEIKQKEKSGEE